MPSAKEAEVPSIWDTHCDGAGLEPSTLEWDRRKKFYYRWLADEHAKDLPLPPRVDLKGKTVLVSGANSGIGECSAYVFAEWGAHVILACRDPPSHEKHPEQVMKDFVERSKGQIKADQLEWWQVEFADLSSVVALGKRLIDSGRVLDYHCANAGINVLKYAKTKDGHDITGQVNYLAHVLLTLITLPAMKKVSESDTSSDRSWPRPDTFASFPLLSARRSRRGSSSPRAASTTAGRWTLPTSSRRRRRGRRRCCRTRTTTATRS